MKSIPYSKVFLKFYFISSSASIIKCSLISSFLYSNSVRDATVNTAFILRDFNFETSSAPKILPR